jgi:formylglycine-generating enzyme required for sulfatase activity
MRAIFILLFFTGLSTIAFTKFTNDNSQTIANNAESIDKLYVEVYPLNTEFPIRLEKKGSYISKISENDFEMVFVKGGNFQMGGNENEEEKPIHLVTLSDFYIGKYEVTQKQWREIMGTDPSYFINCDDCPVEQVSWNDVHEFLKKLNAKTGKKYRLPTEAEWEYAAGGGSFSRTKWAGIDSENYLNSYAWYSSNSNSKTHPVGMKNPNALGLYDMSGNVCEWCADYCNYNVGLIVTDTYTSNIINPLCTTGTSRLNRGGSWYFNSSYARIAYRSSESPDNRYNLLGFRVAITSKGKVNDSKEKEIYNEIANRKNTGTINANSKLDLPTITWDSDIPGTTNVVLFNLKACISSKYILSNLQVFQDGALVIDNANRNLNTGTRGNCDFPFEKQISLSPGLNQIKIIAFNSAGATTSEVLKVTCNKSQKDVTPPQIEIINPQVSRGFKVVEAKNEVTVIGKVIDDSQIKQVQLNENLVPISADGQFQTIVSLKEGENHFKIKATDIFNNFSEYEFSIESNRNINKDNVTKVNHKVALVIGNSAYISVPPLINPVNDADSMANVLSNLGFDVLKSKNTSYQDMKKAISDFGTKISQDKNTTGLFFYAGHGLQVNGRNYLIPIDAIIEKEADVDVYAVDLDGLISNLKYAGNIMNIIILDACRNNPYGRGFRSVQNRGLAVVNAPSGTIISFATAPGEVASDGNAKNGLFTQELLKAIRIPSIKIEDVFKKVRTQVKYLSKEKQIPWENSSLEGDFYFLGK